ncbi:hypothetical protein HOLleu_33353 [Holothuria leucospilota]|uniref:Reverse transcriptase domain-containing protein n=1 Tax=Holothuria leucospilota TaxID=206669 RepID=A0A9Q0YNI3_HOLLE|nr:hypothetical protein HOLleu_33353 [Holothuria leucospilota]
MKLDISSKPFQRAQIYGLPKVHKEGIPLRPIVSSINSPSYNLARHLANIMTPLSGKGMSYIKNSQHFVERAKKILIETSDILVSFDVASLFTNVHINDACKVIGDRLQADPTLHQRTQMTWEEIVHLTKLCLNSTYFKWHGQFYEQCGGQATRILNRAGVKTFYSRSQKLRDILSQPKTPCPKTTLLVFTQSHVAADNSTLVKQNAHSE